MNTAEKTCFKCGATKPLTEYYRHSQMADGHLNKCKTCTKKDTHDRRHNSPARETILAYDRARGNRHKPWYLKHYRNAYPVKTKAKQKVNNAVRDGRLNKPSACEECGSTFAIHGHHDDYLKPLDVRWLCAACHRLWHSHHGEAANAS